MKLSIRIKVVLMILPILVIMEAMVIRAYYTDHKENTVSSYERRFEMLAHSIILLFTEQNPSHQINPQTLEDSKDRLSALCAQLYAQYTTEQVMYIAVLNETATIIGHNDVALVGSAANNSLLPHLRWRETVTVLDAGVYHVITPILDQETTYIGAVIIGIDKAAIEAGLRDWLGNVFRVAVFFLAGSLVIMMLSIEVIVVRPIKYLVAIGEQLLQGNLIHALKLTMRRDEIAQLGAKFVQLSQYLKEVTEIAEHVATGKLRHEIQKRSKRDTLSMALQEMLTYLQSVAMFASKIAGGDLTEEIPLRSDVDAFGRAVRTMRAGLQTLIQQIRDSAEELAKISHSVAALADQDIRIAADEQNVVEKLVSIVTQMGMSAEEIASNMDVLSASVEETSASVVEMANSISSIAANAADLEVQTKTTISALKNTTETLEQVTKKVNVSHTLSEETRQDALEGQEAVEQVTVSMDTIQQTNFSAVEAITRFARQTADIDTILDVIDEITNQSDLLALNASIIAAQAGSHGRGFAVIAGEMRNLANKVDASTKDIAAIVQTVQKETDAVVQEIHRGTDVIAQGVKRTQHARQMLEKISESAQRSSSVVSEIVTALQVMQKTTGHDMKVAMERVYTMTTAITKATSEQKSSTLQMNTAVEHIRDMAVQTQEATTQQLEGVRQLLDVANEVRNLSDLSVESSQHIEHSSGDLNTQAETLLEAVDRFKLMSNGALVEQPAASTSVVNVKKEAAPALTPVRTAELVE